MAPDAGDEEFQRELLELFAQEGQEWLDQAEQALSDLEGRPQADRHAKLVEVIARALTNLGGSAATVNLPDIERSAFALLPLLDQFRNPDAVIQPDCFTSFRDDLRRIAEAIAKLAAVSLMPIQVGAVEDHDDVARRPTTLLCALKELQATRAQASEPNRNLTEVVIRKLERDLQQGLDRLDVSSLRTLLQELQGMDEYFLETLRRRMPAIVRTVARLNETVPAGPLPDQELNETIRHVQDLREIAQTADATPVVTFLTGLHSFLTVVAQRRVVLAAQRIEAVASRLPEVLSMAHQWVAVGESERAAIDKLLPA